MLAQPMAWSSPQPMSTHPATFRVDPQNAWCRPLLDSPLDRRAPGERLGGISAAAGVNFPWSTDREQRLFSDSALVLGGEEVRFRVP